MKELNVDVLIIGAGLSGLATAHYLKDSGKNICIVESRNRIGGRIKSIDFELNKPLEMGATWLGRQHQLLLELMEQVNIEVFPQVIGEKAIYEAISTSPPYLASIPANPEPTLRIKGGSMNLIKALSQNLDSKQILLNTSIQKLEFSDIDVTAFAEAKKIKAKVVVTTIPPNLLINTVSFIPSLPEMFTRIAKTTHTWMSQSIKFALRFSEPFWRNENLSGTVFSNVGPIPEMYDHSNFEDTEYALMGFFNGNYHSISKEERKNMILNQLRKYYGKEIDQYLSYHEEVWSNNKHTHHPYESHILPHQNNGDTLYASPLYENKLIVSGTETSSHYPGYMEGAIFAAQRAAKSILQKTN